MLLIFMTALNSHFENDFILGYKFWCFNCCVFISRICSHLGRSLLGNLLQFRFDAQHFH